MSDTPLPASLVRALDDSREAECRLGIATADPGATRSEHAAAVVRANAARTALEQALGEYVADRERIDWHRQEENARCGYDAYPTLDEYRRALDTLRHMSARTPSPQATDTDG
jgi:hypothetical protein